jgi:hypothetical protein
MSSVILLVEEHLLVVYLFISFEGRLSFLLRNAFLILTFGEHFSAEIGYVPPVLLSG